MKQSHLVVVLIGFILGMAACTSADAPSNDATAATPIPAPRTTDAATPAPTDLGEAPDFTLPTLAGDSLRLADLRGQIVVLNFWATWCRPCIAEIPDLIALHDELSPYGFTMVGISLDEEGNDFVRAFTERFGIPYPIPLDDGSVAEAYGGVWALPTTFVIDSEGRIMHRVVGLFPVEEMRLQFREMLGVPPEASLSH